MLFIQNIFIYIVGKLIFSIVTRARFYMVYFFERIYLTLTSIFFLLSRILMYQYQYAVYNQNSFQG